MKVETVYIPWFGNREDAIFKNYLGEEGKVIQENLRMIDTQKIKEFVEKYGKVKAFQILKKKYLDLSEEEFNKAFDKIENFKGLTRDINTTTAITQREIKRVLFDEENRLKLVWHSQWWLVAMMAIIKEPNILDRIDEIELLAPVSNLKIWRNFHKGREGYLNPKSIVVRKDYLESLDQEEDILDKFLKLLKDRKYKWIVKLVLGTNDPVISLDNFDLDLLKIEYPFLAIEIVEGDHYLWFKK